MAAATPQSDSNVLGTIATVALVLVLAYQLAYWTWVFLAPPKVAALWDVVRDATAGYGFPVLANVDCGHTDPMLTVPLGVPARLDSDANLFATTVPATVD